MKTSSYLLSMSLIFISITMSLVHTNTTHAMTVPTSGPDGKDAGGTFGKYFSGLKNTTACTSPFVISGFAPVTKIPTCKTQSTFIKEYFGSQSGVVPSGSVVIGFDPNTGKMLSNNANTMIAGVFIGMSDGGSMEALIGYTTTGPVYNRNIGYWLDNGGAGIRYVGPVKVGGGFLGGGITVNSVNSPTDATANNHLMRKGQFLSLMKTICDNNIKGIWDGTTCIPKNCTSTPWGTVNHGTSQIGYKESSVDYPGSCVSESRLCDNGKLSGTYANTSCSVKYSYQWEASGFGACNATCGGGKSYQTVWCQRDDGTTVEDGLCVGGKPSTSTDCNTQACEVVVPVCVPNGSCDASEPACGTTTRGVDNCGNTCGKTGSSCGSGTPICVPNGSCDASEPACGTTTNGKDNCGKSCSKTGDACIVTIPPKEEPVCTGCSAPEPGCGKTTNGKDSCGKSCSKTGDACIVTIPPKEETVCTPYACDAPEPACGETTTGTQDSCGKPCTKKGPVCPVSCTPTCGNYCIGATRYYKPCATCEWNFVVCEADGGWRITDH